MPAHFDDRLRIVVRIEDFPMVRIKANYEVMREEQLLATGETTHAFVTGDGKVVRPPKTFLERAREFMDREQPSVEG